MKILVLGSSGLVGSRFVELYKNKYTLLTPSHQKLDVTHIEKVAQYLSRTKPDVVINFSAYTDVGEAENQRGDKSGKCWKVNVEGVRNLLGAIDFDKTRLIQISTDYVFSGRDDDPGPYSSDHPAETNQDKLTWYGFTKAEAERLILEKMGDKATILRIIYPVRAKFDGKLDYLKKALDKYNNGKLPPLFTDQTISIAFIDEACLALERIIEKSLMGIFHAASKDTTTPAEIIPYYLEKVLGKKPDVTFNKMGEWAKRFPQHGGFKVEKTEKALGIKFSTTREIVDKLT